MSGYRGAPPRASNADLSRVVGRLLDGKINTVSSVTLTASATTTTLTDPRITPDSHISFTPLTANAGAALAAGTFYISSRTNGSAVLAHANNAQTDRTFSYAIFG